MSRRAWIIFAVIWLLLLAGAFAVDLPVKQWLFGHRFWDESAQLAKGTVWNAIAKSFGTLYVVIPLLVGLMLVVKLPWRRAVVILLCSITGGIADLVKLAFGRPRPILEHKLPSGGVEYQLTGGFEFHPFHAHVATAFPSSHTMVAFATATALARYYPRWAALAYALATMVAAERVLEVAHHVSDVVAAAGAGVITASICLRLLDKWASPADKASIQKENAP